MLLLREARPQEVGAPEGRSRQGQDNQGLCEGKLSSSLVSDGRVFCVPPVAATPTQTMQMEVVARKKACSLISAIVKI